MFQLITLFILIGGVLCELNLSPDLTQAERYVDDTYIVTCHGVGAKNTTWRGPTGQRISSNKGRVHVEERKSGEDHMSSLVFEKITRDDKGNYTCQSAVNGDSVKRTFKLIVVKPISFMGTLTEQNATENQNALIRCEVTGDPAPTVVWQFNGHTLHGGRYKVMPQGLHIHNISHKDMGEYQCRAFQITPRTSKMVSTQINLRVLHKPMWKNNNSSDRDMGYAYPGGLVNLTCEANAQPEAKFTWFRNAQVVTTDYHNATIILEPHRSVLQFAALTKELYGEYECKAENPLGQIKKTIELVKGVKAEKPSTISVHTVGVHSAQLEIQAQSSSKDNVVLGYRIQFVRPDKDGKYSWDQPDYQDVYKKDGGSPYTIVDLEEKSEYVARAATRNAAGLSEYSSEVSFTTRDPATSTAPPHLPSLFSSFLFILPLALPFTLH